MATIIVQPGVARAGRQRVSLTAIAHHRLMLLLILFMAVTMVLVGRLLPGLYRGLLSDVPCSDRDTPSPDLAQQDSSWRYAHRFESSSFLSLVSGLEQ